MVIHKKLIILMFIAFITFGCANRIPTTNSDYKLDAGNFFDFNTEYSIAFTSDEKAEIQKAWELKLKYNPESAKAIMDFVLIENKGKKVPIYKNFSHAVTIVEYSEKDNIELETHRIVPFVFAPSCYFKKRGVEVIEKQYMASDDIGFISINTRQAESSHYLIKGGRISNRSDWHSFRLYLIVAHEMEHLATKLKNTHNENEEFYVIKETNKIREGNGEPIRSLEYITQLLN